MSAIQKFFWGGEKGSGDQRKDQKTAVMEGDSQKPSVEEQTQVSGAFRKLYQAISEVSQAVAELPIADQEMYNLMAKMDQLNDAFSNLRRVHSQPGSSASSFHSPPLREEIKLRRDITGSKGQPSSTAATSLSLEEKINAISLETKEELEKIKAKHKSDLKTLAGTVALLANDQKDILKRVTTSEEKLQTLVRLQALLNNLHLNAENRMTLKHEVQQVKDDLMKTNETLETVQIILMEHTAACSESDDKEFLVAFHAWADTVLTCYNVDETIEFTRVLLNASSCFDAATSTFTAPVNGMYFFSASINLCSSSLFTAAITCNDDKNLALFGAPAVQDLQTSTSALAALTKGDKVMVKVYGMSSPEGALPGGGFSSFLGFRIP